MSTRIVPTHETSPELAGPNTPPSPITAQKLGDLAITTPHEDIGYVDVLARQRATALTRLSDGKTQLDLVLSGSEIPNIKAIPDSPGYSRLQAGIDAIQEVGNYVTGDVKQELVGFTRGFRAPASTEMTAERAKRLVRCDALGAFEAALKSKGNRDYADVSKTAIARVSGELMLNTPAVTAYAEILQGVEDLLSTYSTGKRTPPLQTIQYIRDIYARQGLLESRHDLSEGLLRRALEVHKSTMYTNS